MNHYRPHPGLKTKKSGVWTSTEAFDPSLVNPHVNLHSLGIANFRGIYSMEMSLGNVMNNITRICKLKPRSVTLSNAHPARVRYELNGTWISDGVAETENEARTASINNSLIYLIHHKGFGVVAAEHVPHEATMRVAQQHLTAGVSATASSDESFQMIRVKVAEVLREFLMNPFMMKLQLGIQELSERSFNDINTTADICRLTHKKVENEKWFWKVNSTYHNLLDRPMASLAARVPSMDTMLFRKQRNRKGNAPVMIPPELQKPSPPKQATSDAASSSPNSSSNIYAHLRASTSSCPTPPRPSTESTYQAGVNKVVETPKCNIDCNQEEQMTGGQFPYDKNCINPEVIKSFKACFKGFKFLGKGWKDSPQFMLEKSALCCDFAYRYTLEQSKPGPTSRLTVKLSMTNNCSNKTFWMSLGHGHSFLEAKDNCVRNAINFLRTRGMSKMSNHDWNQVLQKLNDPEHVWTVSKTELGTVSLLSKSHSGLGTDNIGYRMLQQLGWTPGTGLGRWQQGCLEPRELFVGYSGPGCLGCNSTNTSSDSIHDVIHLDEVLLSFKSNYNAWKLLLSDISRGEAEEILVKSKGYMLQNSYYPEHSVVVIWKKIFASVGTITEKMQSSVVDEDVISDEESLVPAAIKAIKFLEEYDA